MIQVRSRRGANALHALAQQAVADRLKASASAAEPAPTEPKAPPATTPTTKPRSRGALDVLLGD
jgi:hypothetical protein